MIKDQKREIPIEVFEDCWQVNILGFEVETGKGFQFTEEGTILPSALKNHQIQASGMS